MIRHTPLLAGLLCLGIISCRSGYEVEPQGSCAVGFCLPDNSSGIEVSSGGAVTKTGINSDGLSASWSAGDKLAVWAKNSAGTYQLDNTVFSVYGINGGLALFTATLASAMPQGDYTYYATYPEPVSVSGTTATFNIPSVQDGRAGGGADILIADPMQASELEEVKELSDYTKLDMSMEHILHQFRFFVPEGQDKLDGESIESIELVFPQNVAGQIAADLTDPDAALTMADGTSNLALQLAEPLAVSTASAVNYAIASVLPFTAGSDDTFSIKVKSASKIGTTGPVSLKGKTFSRGHSTPVRILLTSVSDRGRIFFNISENNLGENANSVTLTAPEGCIWGDTASNVCVYNPGYELTAGESFEIDFEDIDAYRAFSGKEITVTFDSEHVTTSLTVTMPDMSTGNSSTISVAMPYLLYEDFSSVESFNSGDKYATSNAGDKSAKSFLNGWTGGRIGAEAGHCIRTACRRETSADYNARVDSAPIIALKKSANIKVSYDYGANNQYGGITILGADGNVGQNIHIGYVTSTAGYSSGSSTGTFSDDNTFYVKEYTGTYTNLPNHDEQIIASVPTGTVRITWRAVIEHQAGTTNTTCWFYIDNVKVQISK